MAVRTEGTFAAMFKKLAAAMGAGGAKVDTILDSAGVQPGGTLTGRVEVKGGEVEQTIQGIRAALSAVVEVERTNSQGEDTEHKAKRRVGETTVSGPISVAPGELQTLPFQLVVPAELPPNVIGGRSVSGIRLEVETVLDIEKGRDAKDHDPVDVHALPAQNAVFQAMEQLGFTFKSGDLEQGRLPGSTLGFYAEYEFGARGSGYRFNEVEVKFVTRQSDLEVHLEVDKKGFTLGDSDKKRSFPLSHFDTDVHAVASHLKQILDGV